MKRRPLPFRPGFRQIVPFPNFRPESHPGFRQMVPFQNLDLGSLFFGTLAGSNLRRKIPRDLLWLLDYGWTGL